MPTVPAHAFPHRSASQLLALARRDLDDAVAQSVDGLRYATAHLAGLRAAAAVVAARAKPVPSPRSKLTSVWDMLSIVAPALGEWAAYFAASASKRVAAEAGIPRVVSAPGGRRSRAGGRNVHRDRRARARPPRDAGAPRRPGRVAASSPPRTREPLGVI